MLGLFGSLLVLLAGLLHGFIFVLESFLWTKESTMRTFSIPTREEAEDTCEMAFNQGFYNLFLGIMAVLGAIVYLFGSHTIGLTLMFAGAIAMSLAAAVLLLSSPGKRGAALKQMALPLPGVILLGLSLLLA
jgi:putative membrane protein